MIFFETGIVDVGFDLNRVKTFVLRIDQDILIGGYNVTFDKRTNFVYKTSQLCTGFSIRRTNWKSVVFNEENSIIFPYFQSTLKYNYENRILKKVVSEKEKMIIKWEGRKDYDGILRVVKKESKLTKFESGKFRGAANLEGIVEEFTEQDQYEEIADKLERYRNGTEMVMESYEEVYSMLIDSLKDN